MMNIIHVNVWIKLLVWKMSVKGKENHVRKMEIVGKIMVRDIVTPKNMWFSKKHDTCTKNEDCRPPSKRQRSGFGWKTIYLNQERHCRWDSVGGKTKKCEKITKSDSTEGHPSKRHKCYRNSDCKKNIQVV